MDVHLLFPVHIIWLRVIMTNPGTGAGHIFFHPSPLDFPGRALVALRVWEAEDEMEQSGVLNRNTPFPAAVVRCIRPG